MSRCTYPACRCIDGCVEDQKDNPDEERKRDWNDTNTPPIMEPSE